MIGIAYCKAFKIKAFEISIPLFQKLKHLRNLQADLTLKYHLRGIVVNK